MSIEEMINTLASPWMVVIAIIVPLSFAHPIVFV